MPLAFLPVAIAIKLQSIVQSTPTHVLVVYVFVLVLLALLVALPLRWAYWRAPFFQRDVLFPGEEQTLAGRVALVTGGNSGIGFALCMRLARRGCTVYVGCRNLSKGKRAIRNMVVQARLTKTQQESIHLLKIDVSTKESVSHLATLLRRSVETKSLDCFEHCLTEKRNTSSRAKVDAAAKELSRKVSTLHLLYLNAGLASHDGYNFYELFLALCKCVGSPPHPTPPSPHPPIPPSLCVSLSP